MIKINVHNITGWSAAVYNMRFLDDSLEEMSSYESEEGFVLGKNDLARMVNLTPFNDSFLDNVKVYTTITAPLSWWMAFNGNVHDVSVNIDYDADFFLLKPFKLDNFSHEDLYIWEEAVVYLNNLNPHKPNFVTMEQCTPLYPKDILNAVIKMLNTLREAYLSTNDEKYVRAIKQLLPASYMQTCKVVFSYKDLSRIYGAYNCFDLKYDWYTRNVWRDFCNWIESLPSSVLITGAL